MLHTRRGWQPVAKRVFYIARLGRKTHTTVEGRAKSGEVSPQGLVAHTEDWQGRIRAKAAPSTIRYIKTPDGIRPMTMAEMIGRGYFIVGKGPKGYRSK